MSYHHELHQNLPQGLEPWPGHCGDQEVVGRHRYQEGARPTRQSHHHSGRRVDQRDAMYAHATGFTRENIYLPAYYSQQLIRGGQPTSLRPSTCFVPTKINEIDRDGWLHHRRHYYIVPLLSRDFPKAESWAKQYIKTVLVNSLSSSLNWRMST